MSSRFFTVKQHKMLFGVIQIHMLLSFFLSMAAFFSKGDCSALTFMWSNKRQHFAQTKLKPSILTQRKTSGKQEALILHMSEIEIAHSGWWMSQMMIFGCVGGHMLISTVGFMEMLSTWQTTAPQLWLVTEEQRINVSVISTSRVLISYILYSIKMCEICGRTTLSKTFQQV